MKIGELLADPLIAGILIAVFILPVLWGLMKVLEWIRFHDRKKANEDFANNN